MRRALGRHMSKYIPGNPSIVPQNMPGAGGNKAAGYVYSVAPKDGTAIGALFPGGILAPLLGDTPIQHDPTKFIYRRQRQQRRLYLRRALRLADQVVQGRVHAGGDRRRQQRRRHHPRHADAVEQRARHQIPHRHRLCRHAGDRARGRAQEIARAVRLRLHQPALGDAALARPTSSCASSCRRTPRARRRSTSRACRAPSISPRPRKTGR